MLKAVTVIVSGGGGGGSGTVTQVNTGTGLTGGPITTTGTISVASSSNNSLAGYNNTGVFSTVTVGSGLSLSGGTLTASGAVTSVSNTDSTVTVSPTSGAVVVSLNLANPNVWSGQQNFGSVSITSSSASIAWNLNTAQVANHTMTENTTLANPSNMVSGGTYILRITQHASVPKTLAFDTVYKFPGGTDPVITPTAGAIDIVTFVSDGSSMYGIMQRSFS